MVVAGHALEEGVAVLGGAKARLDLPPLPHRAIQRLDAPQRVWRGGRGCRRQWDQVPHWQLERRRSIIHCRWRAMCKCMPIHNSSCSSSKRHAPSGRLKVTYAEPVWWPCRPWPWPWPCPCCGCRFTEILMVRPNCPKYWCSRSASCSEPGAAAAQRHTQLATQACEKTLPIIHKPSAVSKAPAAAAAGSVLLRQQVQHTSVQISSDRPTAYTRLGCTTRMFCRQAGAMDGANGWGNWQQHAAALPCSPGKQHSAAQCPHTQAASLFMLPHRTAAQLHAPQPAALGARADWRG